MAFPEDTGTVWRPRYLEAHGIHNRVVDSASIEVNRRYRRVKTDRLDVGKLLNMLVRSDQGESKIWSVVHVPKQEEEDQRQLHRELMALKRQPTHHINRMKGLLASQGIVLAVKTKFLEQLRCAQLWDGAALPPGLHTLLVREHERLRLVREHIHQVEVTRKEALRSSHDPAIEQVRRLLQLKGIGMNSAWVYGMEFFAWRAFHNPREPGRWRGWLQCPTQVATVVGSAGSAKPATVRCGHWRSRLPDRGCATSPTAN